MTPKPERPDWAVYGPWWFELGYRWYVLSDTGKPMSWSENHGRWLESRWDALAIELLRLAEENERLKLENIGLKTKIEELEAEQTP